MDEGVWTTDDAHPLTVLRMVKLCAGSWVGDARLLGNVRACDIVRACDAAGEWGEGIKAEREAIAAEARRYAGHYPEASDGRNTFIMLAEWIERR